MLSLKLKLGLFFILFINICAAQITGRIKPVQPIKKDSIQAVTKKDTIVSTSPITDNNASDTLYFVNQTKLIVKVKDVNMLHVVCSNPEMPKEKDKLYDKKDIRCIAYGNGSLQIVSLKQITSVQDYGSYSKGVSDASVCYKHPGGSIGTGITSLLTGGILGLIPAIACSSTTPKFINLNLPKNAPVKNKDYMLGYVSKAKKMKQKKVWIGYSIGVAGAVAFLLSRQ